MSSFLLNMRTQVVEIVKTKTKMATVVAVALVGIGLAFIFLPSTKIYQKIVFYVPPNGCFIKIDGQSTLITNADKDQCRDLSLLEYASEDSSKEDLYFTLKSFNQSFPSDKEVLNSDKIKFVYEYGNGKSTDFNAYLDDIKTAAKCKSFKYSGIEFNCFNEIKDSKGIITKSNNLKQIIKYVAFLKYASRDIANPLNSNQMISPFNYVFGKKIIFYDASVPSLVQENGTCGSGTSGAHTGGTTKPGSSQHKVFVCQKSLDNFNKIHQAGVIFHEALHFDKQGHDYDKNEEICVFNKDKEGNADYDVVSVYGGQIKFLYDISTNSNLSCSIRKAAYNDAVPNLDHLCLKIVSNFVAPACD